MPSASSTSADPAAELAARLPCFATAAPAAAATSAAAVEMLNVFAPSPPVPTMSTTAGACGGDGHDVLTHRVREAGDLVRGLALRAQCDEEARDLGGVASPSMIEPISCVRVRARQVVSVEQELDRRADDHPQEVLRHRGPERGQHALGMELHPSIGSSRCRTPITSPSAVCGGHRELGGTSSAASEW